MHVSFTQTPTNATNIHSHLNISGMQNTATLIIYELMNVNPILQAEIILVNIILKVMFQDVRPLSEIEW